jgi:hypothetical protein
VQGNRDALAIVRVPSEEEEQKRAIHRQRSSIRSFGRAPENNDQRFFAASVIPIVGQARRLPNRFNLAGGSACLRSDTRMLGLTRIRFNFCAFQEKDAIFGSNPP